MYCPGVHPDIEKQFPGPFKKHDGSEDPFKPQNKYGGHGKGVPLAGVGGIVGLRYDPDQESGKGNEPGDQDKNFGQKLSVPQNSFYFHAIFQFLGAFLISVKITYNLPGMFHGMME
jgi:hypothetical protein